MKRQTPEHPKMLALARLLKIPRTHAVGIMECLWQWTAAYAADGDLSRWTPEQVAAAVDWPDAAQLIDVLKSAECGWLDADSFVHDWPHHCEDAVHLRLARAGRSFACGCTPKTNRMAKSARQACAAHIVCARHAHIVRTASALPQPQPQPQPQPNPPTPQGVDVPPLSQNELDAQRLADVYRAYSKCTNLKEKSYSHWFDALATGIKPADIEAEILGGNKLRPPWNILKALDRETPGRARDSPARPPPKRYEPIGDLARAPRKAIGPEDPLP